MRARPPARPCAVGATATGARAPKTTWTEMEMTTPADWGERILVVIVASRGDEVEEKEYYAEGSPSPRRGTAEP